MGALLHEIKSNRLEISEFNNKIEFYDNNKENKIKNSIFEEDRNNKNCNLDKPINQDSFINEENFNDNNSELSKSIENSEINFSDNIINEDDKTIDKLMGNLNIKDTDNYYDISSNKNDISHLPLLKRIEQKNNIIVDNILNPLKNIKPKKRRICYPKDYNDDEIARKNNQKKKKKGWAKKNK